MQYRITFENSPTLQSLYKTVILEISTDHENIDVYK